MEQKKDARSKESEPTGKAGPAPSISLPKGGGAIRGIDEKFAANPVTGTGSMTVPIATSPGRAGFGPQLSLSYDSGSGNGPFGFGWSLSLPSITRKSDKGLPQYLDGEESDVFILSGSEDLVPVFKKDANGNWIHDAKGNLIIDDNNRDGYTVRPYRPRIEGLFARIERWTRADGDQHWRSISKDNILTIYGKDNNSRIYNPNNPQHVFSWLICETRDHKGNVVIYEYKPEDGAEVDLTKAHECNRGKRDDSRRSANRYLKRIRYGNRISLLDNAGRRPRFLTGDAIRDAGWMFQVVFDYGEHDHDDARPNDDEERGQNGQKKNEWLCRHDPFSSYRAGFEVRTYRLCQRVLMFHHFPNEQGIGQDCLVRSTDFVYRNIRNNPDDLKKGHPVASFIASVIQNGYKRKAAGGYLKKSMPPLEFEYSQVEIQEEVREINAASLENMPIGLDGSSYQWVDLDGEGVSGILTEQAGAWFYKSNLGNGHFGSLQTVARKPALAALSAGRQKLLDLAGDGQLDLAEFTGPTPGFFERTEDGDWEPFKLFPSLPDIAWDEPNLRFVDMNGDGHADVLITDHQVFTWHPSLAEEGFGSARRVYQPMDEEQGPRLVFADGVQSIYLADMCGDRLTDLVRIRNGEVCYWPNLGYGRFGAKVTMDNAPQFDSPDQFSQQRVRLADIDGSGNSDIIYLGRDGVRVYFNESGNGWSLPRRLSQLPGVDDHSNITTTDLLGNGTACLVWSSPLPGHARRPIRYIDLMGGQKPHLLVKTVNNLGSETRIHYTPSTKFYLKDKAAGKPWITRIHFPVQVVEGVEIYDHISRNRFATRYAYHHGYFDGVEREFRGFGLVEQRDTEEFAALSNAALSNSDAFPTGDNTGTASHVPPVLTRTWFHTGVYLGRDRVSKFFAGLLDANDEGEYYREPGLTDEEAKQLLLDDTVLPVGLTLEEEREACRALKGAILRQEVYALDGGGEANRPYSVTERNYSIKLLQPRADARHAVFFTHARERIEFYYERKLVDVNGLKRADPRLSHAMSLEVDPFGNTLRSLTIGYRRRELPGVDLPEQNETHLTLTANRFANRPDEADWYRLGLEVESQTYEVVKPPEPQIADTRIVPFRFEQMVTLIAGLFPLDNPEPESAKLWPYEKWDWRINSNNAPADTRLRLIERVRVLYRADNLTGFLPLGTIESLALPGEVYKLALTPGLLSSVLKREQGGQPPEDLLPNPAPLLEGKGADQGGFTQLGGAWWIPSGRTFFDPAANVADPSLTAAQELAAAHQHFFLTRKFTDPFGQSALVDYDVYCLLIIRTQDALANTVESINDYRALQPKLITDPNRNRSAAAFDALGLVVATAVMGKDGQSLGDLLEGFDDDPPVAALQSFAANPRDEAALLLGKATTRIVYDLDRFRRCKQPPFAAALERETHFFDPGGAQSKILISFSYSDGFAREIQKKTQAEPGDAPQRQPDAPAPSGDIRPGELIRDANGEPAQAAAARRWVGTGRTVFNNKGKPVRQYEPFFSSTHLYEEEREMTDIGVSPVLFYDPVGRVIATLHPNHTYEKVVFDAWRQKTYDVNDTVAPSDNQTGDPRTDEDIKGYVAEFFKTQLSGWQTWHAQRINNQMGVAERTAAQKAAEHANTPAVSHLDSLGRAFLTIADNGADQNGAPQKYAARNLLDIEGNQRAVIDAKNRIVMRYDYNLLGERFHQAGMDAGERWMLNDVTSKPVRTWDSRRFIRRMSYDELRRPTALFVTENGVERLAERAVYGEGLGDANNHRMRAHQVFDGAGVLTAEAYDFKGNLLRSKRELLPDYKQAVNWLQNLAPTDGAFTITASFDALNRPLAVTTPDDSVYRPTFNEANMLERVEVSLQGAAATSFVTNINYNAKGQRELIAYGNGAQTTYEYDPMTFRLTKLKTTRPANPDVIASQLFKSTTLVQDLRYTHDPVGNIIRIEDAALKTIFHNGEQVEPVCDYAYDAIYRLIEAHGREHIGQTTFDFNPMNGDRRDFPFFGSRANPNDMQAMRNYTERYEYDEVGNFEFMRHAFNGGGWNRSYDYEEASLVEPAKVSNRLTRTTVGGFTENLRLHRRAGRRRSRLPDGHQRDEDGLGL